MSENIISTESLDKTIEALKSNNINVVVVETKAEVKDAVEKLLEEGSEVMQMTSVTLQDTGVTDLINLSGKYKSVKNIMKDAEKKWINKERNY